MTAKSKAAPSFKTGDAAIVRDIQRDKIIDTGTIVKVTATRVVFETIYPLDDRPRGWLPRFLFKRKGTEWIEVKKDYCRLEPTSF